MLTPVLPKASQLMLRARMMKPPQIKLKNQNYTHSSFNCEKRTKNQRNKTTPNQRKTQPHHKWDSNWKRRASCAVGSWAPLWVPYGGSSPTRWQRAQEPSGPLAATSPTLPCTPRLPFLLFSPLNFPSLDASGSDVFRALFHI